jgi:hypothetical protein
MLSASENYSRLVLLLHGCYDFNMKMSIKMKNLFE